MPWLGVTRSLIGALGLCSIAWGCFSWSAFRAELPVAMSSQRILSGDRFSTEQLNALRLQLNELSRVQLRPGAASDVAVIRLRLVEDDLTAGNDKALATDIADLRTALSTALAVSPGDAFLWLIDFWIQDARLRSADAAVKPLRMSYSSGPNEAWIAAKRNPVALGVFSSLPDELAERVVVEFVGLVRSGLYEVAANIIAGPGWAVHDKLLGRLVEVNESDRRKFAKVLESKDLTGAVVPGTGG